MTVLACFLNSTRQETNKRISHNIKLFLLKDRFRFIQLHLNKILTSCTYTGRVMVTYLDVPFLTVKLYRDLVCWRITTINYISNVHQACEMILLRWTWKCPKNPSVWRISFSRKALQTFPRGHPCLPVFTLQAMLSTSGFISCVADEAMTL